MRKTKRGFNVYGEYKDSKGSTVRIQESSAAIGGPYVWIFCKDRDGHDAHLCKETATGATSVSPHLSRSQARRVAKALLEFAK